MKFTAFEAAVGLLQVQAVLAQTTTGTPSTTTSATTTSAEATCTASLITKLCDYEDPGIWAVAEDSVAHCWEYCNNNPPCSFVIFYPGNPTTGSGTCWLYPGEDYDESLGSTSGCSSPYLQVYDKPTCTGGSTTTAACAATETPTAVAEVCDYPTPDDNCFSSCSASLGAVNCLSQCVEADACEYVVFNPNNDDNDPYASGSCWMYDSGSYNASAASICSGDPEQYVYENPCPKPSSSSATTASTATATGTDGTGTGTAVAAQSAASGTQTSAGMGLSRRNPLAAAMRWLSRN
ncbi:hypothetical protein E8E14_008240 [Neopestalotiopsis sp. 37M]|nr:hypothetical protein E8E14_008240 [Neopestalotiopsis sp. 37M]